MRILLKRELKNNLTMVIITTLILLLILNSIHTTGATETEPINITNLSQNRTAIKRRLLSSVYGMDARIKSSTTTIAQTTLPPTTTIQPTTSPPPTTNPPPTPSPTPTTSAATTTVYPTTTTSLPPTKTSKAICGPTTIMLITLIPVLGLEKKKKHKDY